MCDIFGLVQLILIVCLVTIIPRQNTSACPIIFDFVVPTEGAKIMIQIL